MIVHRILGCCLTIFVVALFATEAAFAHGGVVGEDDLCIIKVNYLRAHFKIYQPRSSGHEQFCEDLPMSGESIFVMEYQHDSLSDMLIDFRIIRDVTGKGRFARMEDVERIGNLDEVTVFFRPAIVEPDVYAVNHEFADEGDFIGIVTAARRDTGEVYAAVFPFAVGFSGFGYWPFFIALLIAIQLQYLLMSGRLGRWRASRNASAAVLLLSAVLLSLPAQAADYRVTYSTPGGEPEINRMHHWILHVTDADGAPVEGATLTVTGGMPEHDHGLPTRPRITREIGGGDYRLDGMRFHMRGYWEIVVSVETDAGTSAVTIVLQL